MKNKSFAMLAILGISLVVLVGCNEENNEDPIDETDYTHFTYSGVFDDSDYLTTLSERIVTVGDDDNPSKEVVLRGVNVGGYLVTENWMCCLDFSNKPDSEEYEEYDSDHLSATKVFTSRFGDDLTRELWSIYRENFWTTNDFLNVVDMGMNVLRLPFTYMSVDPTYNNVYENEHYDTYNFDVLDEFIKEASDNGIYVILDLHGAYGSQNGQDHSGEIKDDEEVDFYTNEEDQQKTIDLWCAIAERYKDNPAIAGFDLLNEPGIKGGTTGETQWEFYDKLTKAIREIDNDRILIYEACWDGANLPKPSVYGWYNAVYSFHHYMGANNSDPVGSFTSKILGVERQSFNVPYYMGEFTCYNDSQDWKDVLNYLNSENWSWTPWTYKLNRSANSTSYNGWSIYCSNVESVDIYNDSYDEIIEKFETLQTVTETSFTDGTTLRSIYKTYLNQ